MPHRYNGNKHWEPWINCSYKWYVSAFYHKEKVKFFGFVDGLDNVLHISGPVAGNPDLTTYEKCWVVFGVGLQKVLVPELRRFVEGGVTNLYIHLIQKHQIHQQSHGNHLKTYPQSSKYNFEYKNINKNDTITSTSNSPAKAQYDYNVSSPIDLARLYLQSHMAKFQGFADADASALLGLINNIDDASCSDPRFVRVQAAAQKVKDRRNQWAHAEDDLMKWDKTNLQAAYKEMKNLLAAVYGSGPVPAQVTTDLDKWRDIGKQPLNYTQEPHYNTGLAITLVHLGFQCIT